MAETLSQFDGDRYSEAFISVLSSTASDDDHELDANRDLLEEYSPGLYDFVDRLLGNGFFNGLPVTERDAAGIRAGAITALVALAKYVDTAKFREQLPSID